MMLIITLTITWEELLDPGGEWADTRLVMFNGRIVAPVEVDGVPIVRTFPTPPKVPDASLPKHSKMMASYAGQPYPDLDAALPHHSDTSDAAAASRAPLWLLAGQTVEVDGLPPCAENGGVNVKQGFHAMYAPTCGPRSVQIVAMLAPTLAPSESDKGINAILTQAIRVRNFVKESGGGLRTICVGADLKLMAEHLIARLLSDEYVALHLQLCLLLHSFICLSY